MKILLFGKNGQVGWELSRSLLPLGELMALGRNEADFSNSESLRKIVRDIKPDVIVNAVAYTAVDKAENEEEEATLINGVAPGVLAEEVRELGALFVHYSTDYVFDGFKHGAYNEIDVPGPLNAYGRSKLAGEDAVGRSGCKYLIFRTSWVYSTRGNNFVKTILRLAKERDEIKVVTDQMGVPTSSEFIADITALCVYRVMIDKALAEHASGIYHLTPGGVTSWHGVAQKIITEALKFKDTLRLKSENILPVTTEEYGFVALRPLNSRLDTEKLSRLCGLYVPDWEEHLTRTISELMATEKE